MSAYTGPCPWPQSEGRPHTGEHPLTAVHVRAVPGRGSRPSGALGSRQGGALRGRGVCPQLLAQASRQSPSSSLILLPVSCTPGHWSAAWFPSARLEACPPGSWTPFPLHCAAECLLGPKEGVSGGAGLVGWVSGMAGAVSVCLSLDAHPPAPFAAWRRLLRASRVRSGREVLGTS